MPTRIVQWGPLLLVILGFIAFAYFMMGLSRQSAIEEIHRENTAIVNTQANELKSELQKYLLVPFILSENPDVIQTLNSREPKTVEQLNIKLEKLALQTGASYIFVFDTTGTTIASSNYNSPNSFIGESYKFRPYFRQAMDMGSAEYFAKGETTGKAGLFLAGRISDNDEPLGGIVIKVEFSQIAQRWNDQNATSLVTDKNTIILFSNDKSLNYKTLDPLTDEQRTQIIADKQFRDEPLSTSGIDIADNLLARDQTGQRLLVDVVSIPELNWNLFRIIPLKPAVASANIRAQLIIVLVGVFLSGIALFIRRRLVREKEKAEMTEFLKSEVEFLSQQKELVFIESLEAHYEQEVEIEVLGEKKKVRLRGFIDRIDSVGGKIRIIDYKSGKVKLEEVKFKKGVNSRDDVAASFSATTKKHLLQLTQYAYLYYKKHGVIPESCIVSFISEKFKPFILQGKDVDLNEIIINYPIYLGRIIEDMYNSDVPFEHADEYFSYCNYCK